MRHGVPLDLPDRTPEPRRTGLTTMSDNGVPTRHPTDVVEIHDVTVELPHEEKATDVGRFARDHRVFPGVDRVLSREHRAGVGVLAAPLSTAVEVRGARVA